MLFREIYPQATSVQPNLSTKQGEPVSSAALGLITQARLSQPAPG